MLKIGDKRWIYLSIVSVIGWGVYKMSLPLSIRNNNPLNIRDDGHTEWEGLSVVRSENGYLKFVAPEYGYRAAVKVLRFYRKKYGVIVLEDIIARWAPEFENPTSNYQKFVRETADFQPGHIVVEQEGDYVPLMMAMAIFEAGSVWRGHPSLSVNVINKGVALA